MVLSEYGVHLTEITLDVNGPVALRQMSALLLKQYVDAHWSCDAEKFKEPETTPKAKLLIKEMLPVGLKESISKVSIRHYKYTNEFPTLLSLTGSILSGVLHVCNCSLGLAR